MDQILDLTGTSGGDMPLIDDIPVSEDPDLYLVAEVLGERAQGLRAWEIAPQRYQRGEADRPVRIDAEK